MNWPWVNKDYCIVLYCIVLYCIVLYCIVLYCIVLYCIVLYCIVLYCIVLYCIVKQSTHQVSCQSLFNHGNFYAGLCIKQGSSRGSLQRFFSSSLQLNRSIILPFSELMKKEPRHHLVQNCLHSTFALEQLPRHFLRVSCTSVSDVFFFK